MTYTEYMALNPLQRFWYKFLQFIKAIPAGLAKFFCAIGRGIVHTVTGIGGAIKNYFVGFVKGDILTKISYFIMGFGNLFRGQLVKGLFYLAVEVGYIAYMVFFGAQYLSLFGTMAGIVNINKVEFLPGLYKEEKVIEFSSVQILLFGILTIMVTIAAIAIYFVSVKSARNNEATVKSGKKPNNFREDMKALLDAKFHSTMLSLPIILICVFVLLPLLFMIVMAFTSFSVPDGNVDSFNWIGLDNFKDVFAVSSGAGSLGSTFLKIAGWTLIWAFFATFSNYIFGMIVALMINKKGIRLKKLWRTLFVMSIAVPQFVTLLLVAKMLGSEPNSPLNLIVSMFTGGNAAPVNLFETALSARITVIIVNIWVGVPYTILMTTGILMNIPEDLYESARIDGAGPVKSFTKITLPYMLFVTTPYLITTFIGNVNNFNVIYLITGGEPSTNDYYKGSGKTDLLITLLFKMSVNDGKYGLGAAIGILVFLVCATLSLVTFNMTKSAKNEEAFS